jgi:hypothetical protein
MDSNEISNLQRKQQTQKKIINVLKNAQISSNNYDSTKKPFFSKDNNVNPFDINIDINVNTDSNLISNKIPLSLNRNIKFIYKLLNDTKLEIYLGEWTFFSIDKAIEIYDGYCKNGQIKVFDIGYKYMGMGHILVVSCDLDTNLLFFRPDGGSNGYDREDNFNYLIKNGTSPYKNKQIFFSNWFFNIKI